MACTFNWQLASYPNRADFKALTITGEGMAVADGQPNAEAARQDALQRCNARTKRQCRLYAKATGAEPKTLRKL